MELHRDDAIGYLVTMEGYEEEELEEYTDSELEDMVLRPEQYNFA